MSKHTSQRQEPDQARILSGVFEGRTTGTAIGLLVDNVDARSRDYEKIKDRFRPGHADYAYQQKYGIRDYRGGGRSSARITVATVAAGAIARKYLREQLGSPVAGYISQIGPHRLECIDTAAARTNPFFCAEPEKLPLLRTTSSNYAATATPRARALACAQATCRPGLGEPMFDRLDADIAFAMMGINAAKAVEIGDGVAVAGQRGSLHRDELTPGGSPPTIPAGRSAASVPART
jgi:chorismate synthase